MDEADLDDMIAPYQKLLNELNADSSDQLSAASKRKMAIDANKKLLKKIAKLQRRDEKKKIELDSDNEEIEENEEEEDEEDGDESDDQEKAELEAANTYSQEVLCKDALDSDDVIKNGT